jgi:hypothetical protein
MPLSKIKSPENAPIDGFATGSMSTWSMPDGCSILTPLLVAPRYG